MLRRHSMSFALLSLSLAATACDEGSPDPDGGADGAEAPVDGDGDEHLDAPEEETDDDSVQDESTDDATSEEPPSDMPMEEPQAEACDTWKASRDCVDAEGVQFCDYFDGELLWGGCLTSMECMLGDSQLCFEGDDLFGDLSMGCVLFDGVPQWDHEACNTPLVLSFSADAPVEMFESSAAFDIAGAGECLTTDWPAASNPWLAIDLDRNGFIDGGHELFGSGSVLETGRHARNGFIALASLDSNRDGRITAADARFGELLVWRDEDGDKLSLPHELGTLGEAGVQNIELDFSVREQCDERGNCARERSSFGFVGAAGKLQAGEVVDIHLACQ
jgi:hypothetical protein